MKSRRIVVGTVMAALLLGGIGVPAAASAAEEAEGISITAPPLTIPDTAASDAEIKSQLEALVGTQTPEEIAAIMEGPNYALGGEDGAIVAAMPKPSIFTPRAITIRGPGCATGDACANNVNGYYGTGSLSINLSGITKVTSGSLNTTWWYNNNATGYNLTANTTFFTPSPTKLTKITRSN